MSARILCACHRCGKPVEKYPADLRKSRSGLVFCSRPCMVAWRNEKAITRVAVSCGQCGAALTRAACLAKRDLGRFCNRSCFDAYVASPTRFWERVNRDGPIQPHTPHLGSCWEWQGPLHQGYGHASFQGEMTGAHRVAWALAEGALPELCVLHACDNRRCVRREHLFLGTRADNTEDMRAKGRADRVKKLAGARAPHSKLSEDDVRAIRRRRAAGERLAPLAREYRVTESVVSEVCSRKTYRNVA